MLLRKPYSELGALQSHETRRPTTLTMVMLSQRRGETSRARGGGWGWGRSLCPMLVSWLLWRDMWRHL